MGTGAEDKVCDKNVVGVVLAGILGVDCVTELEIGWGGPGAGLF